VTSSGSWAQRQGLHFRRLCARPGCGTPATATLRFQPTLRQAWLVDLDESAARTQGDLCRRHAAALVLPRGWELHDQRTDRPRLVEKPPAEPERGATPRRVRVRRRAARVDPERAPSPLPGFEPVVVPNGKAAAEAAEADEADEGDEVVEARDDTAAFDTEALTTILDARTPLLRRAFRNAQPDENSTS
jgi:hypothetical protein